MRNCLIVIVAIFLVSVICLFGGYWYGREKALGLQSGTLVAEVSALQELRKGDVSNAVNSIEIHCYSVAVCLLESRKWRKNAAVNAFIEELSEYRRQFARNKSEWTVTENILEKYLGQRAGIKCCRSN